MLSSTVEYALSEVVHLASRQPTPCTTKDIASATGIPKDYLVKVIQSLNRQGIVITQRGIGGGVTLAKPAGQLTVLEVVNAIEPLRRYSACPAKFQESGGLCSLHRHLDQALAMLESNFHNTTIAKLIALPEDAKAFCLFPHTAIVPTSVGNPVE